MVFGCVMCACFYGMFGYAVKVCFYYVNNNCNDIILG